MKFNPYTTQIEPHDAIAKLSLQLTHFNTVMLDFSRDMWGYISLGYFKQKLVKGEIGSSTMPHKVNPIDFENSEGNFGLANSLYLHFAQKLPISRFQRDLSDSTVMRNLGIAFAYQIQALKSVEKGLNRIEVNKEVLEKELENNYELLAEPIQTVMRKYDIPEPYEKLKELTKGKKIKKQDYIDFVENLELPKEEKERMKLLTPGSYTGLAAVLARKVNEFRV